MSRLARAIGTQYHAFWPCDLSVLDPILDTSRIQGSRQVTDFYLLALAISKGGRLVTLDRRLPMAAVRGARAEHLVVI